MLVSVMKYAKVGLSKKNHPLLTHIHKMVYKVRERSIIYDLQKKKKKKEIELKKNKKKTAACHEIIMQKLNY